MSKIIRVGSGSGWIRKKSFYIHNTDGMRDYIKFEMIDWQEEVAEQCPALTSASPLSSSSSHLPLVALLARAVLYGAPVVFGILFVRFYTSVLS